MKSFVIGVIVGAVLAGFLMWSYMPNLMLTVTESKFGVEETVTAIQASAMQNGWKVPKVYDMQKSLEADGFKIGKLNVLSLCSAEHASKILDDDSRKKVAAMMPCRIGVYEGSDGKTYITQMNIGLMSKMFGGVIEDVMGKVSEEEHHMLKDIIKES